MPLIELAQDRQFQAAWAAPTRPKTDHELLSTVIIGQLDGATIQGCQGEVGRRLAKTGDDIAPAKERLFQRFRPPGNEYSEQRQGRNYQDDDGIGLGLQ